MFHRLRPLRRPLATIAAGGTAFVASQLIDNRPALSAQKPAPAPKLFCWGRLVPSDAAQVPYRAREPVDVDFWASRGARVAQICYGDDHGAGGEGAVLARGHAQVRAPLRRHRHAGYCRAVRHA